MFKKNYTTMWFLAATLVAFFIVKVFPLLPSKKTHHTERINKSENEFKFLHFSNDGIGVFNKGIDTLAQINIEIAELEEHQLMGLKNRNVLPPNSGFLVMFKEAGFHSIDMQNTPFDVDLVFINDNGEVVLIESNTVPYTTTIYGSEVESKFVLKVDKGFATKYKIDLDSHFSIKK